MAAQFLKGGPTIPEKAIISTLESWTKISTETENFSGTVKYEIVFNNPSNDIENWLLSLGGVRESAKAWNAMVKEAIHTNGSIGYLQSTGKEPKDGQPLSYHKIPDFEDYGLGCFLLAGSEIYKMKK